ncbi:hypothetical protein PsYK624_139360 [Phanerochaete sordida]|uniref:Uncharacterized protein n=1 Tax=Phanerochaete sordida TaxID=48140 RepID=A0A9P3GLU8_9APHY|nr:hypothetical protein PsYK624_139360 [Phanerochaete sordida]
MEARRKDRGCARHRGQCADTSRGRDPPTFIFISEGSDRRAPAPLRRRRAHHMMEARRRAAPTARDRWSFVSLDPSIQLGGFILHLLRTASKFLDRLERASLPRSHLLPARMCCSWWGRGYQFVIPFHFEGMDAQQSSSFVLG